MLMQQASETLNLAGSFTATCESEIGHDFAPKAWSLSILTIDSGFRSTYFTGDWPAIAPAEATFRGVMGFLNNVTREQVMSDLETVIRGASDWLKDHTEIKFLYHHDASITDPDDPLVTTVMEAAKFENFPLHNSIKQRLLLK
jgi:acetylornithine deacetylase/succinyl-diaminopimelate desuccinylase-like protein